VLSPLTGDYGLVHKDNLRCPEVTPHLEVPPGSCVTDTPLRASLR
jgi:hypothetical protein